MDRRLTINTTLETERDAMALIGAFIAGDASGFQAVLDAIAGDAPDDGALADQLANMFVNLCKYASRQTIHRAFDEGRPIEQVHREEAIIGVESHPDN
jgi:hypothetical protein